MIRRIFATMTVTAAISALAGCAMAPLPASMVYCKIEKPISWSTKDTDQTIREVKEHNAVFSSLCKR